MVKFTRMALAVLAGLIASPAIAQDAPKLTIYTYDGFAAEWGPGPGLKAGFEATCGGCTVEFVAADSSIGTLRRVQLEGATTEADLIVGPRYLHCRGSPRHRPFRRSWPGPCRSRPAPALDRPAIRARRLRPFRLRLRHRQGGDAAHILRGADRAARTASRSPSRTRARPRPALASCSGSRPPMATAPPKSGPASSPIS